MSSQHLFVDSVLGNDGTAIISNPSLPWKTITAARNYYVSNDLGATGSYTIWIRSGIYNGEGNLYGIYAVSSGTPILRYHFEEGTQVSPVSGNSLFASTTGQLMYPKLEVTGWARFSSSNSKIFDLHEGNETYFECLSITSVDNLCQNFKFTLKVKDYLTSTTNGFTLNNGNHTVYINKLLATNNGIEFNSSSVGTLDLTVNQLTADYGYVNQSTKAYTENIKIGTLTALTGIYFTGSGETGISELDIESIIAVDFGVLFTTQKSLTIDGSIGSIMVSGTSGAGILNQSGQCIDTWRIGSITADYGIALNGGLVTESNFQIERIKSVIGIFNVKSGVTKLRGSIGSIIATDKCYYINNTLSTVEDSMIFGYLESLSGTGIYIKGYSFGNAISTFTVDKMKCFNGIFHNSLSYSVINVTATVNKFEGNYAYLNTSAANIMDCIKFGEIVANTGISINHTGGATSSFDVGFLTANIGISIENYGNTTINGRFNRVETSNIGYQNISQAQVIDTMIFNSLINQGTTGIYINSALSDFNSSIEIKELVSSLGIKTTGSYAAKLNLAIESFTGTTGADFSGAFTINGKIDSLKSTGSGLLYNSSGTSVLEFESMESSGISLSAGTLKMQGNNFVNNGNGTIGINITGGNHHLMINEIIGFNTALSATNSTSKFTSQKITGNGVTGVTGINLLGGAIDGHYGNVTNFDFAIQVIGGSGKHRVIADYVEGRSRSMVIGTTGYNPNLDIGGIFVNRVTNASILLQNKCTPSGSTAVQLLGGTVLQAKANGIAIGLFPAAYGSVLVLLGSVIMNPQTENAAFITYQNSGFLLNTTKTYY